MTHAPAPDFNLDFAEPPPPARPTRAAPGGRALSSA